MKIVSLLITLFIIPNALFAQCDSLKEASISETGVKQIDALNSYARCFLFTDPTKTDSIAQIAEEKATAIDYKIGLGRSRQILGLIEVYHLENEIKGVRYFSEALTLFEQCGDSLEVGKVLGDIASSQQRQGDIGRALKNSIRALAIFEEEEFIRGISLYSNNIGSIYMITGDEIEAIPYFRRGLSLIDTTEDRENYAIQLSNLFAVSMNLDIEDSVYYYFNRVLRVQKEMSLFSEVSRTYSNMQTYFQEITDAENPIFEIRKSYADSAYFYAQLSQTKIELAVSNYHKGLLLWHEEKNALAYPFLEKAIEWGKNYPLIIDEMTESYWLMSDISNKNGNYEVSRAELFAAYELSKEINNAEVERSIMETKARFSLDQSKKELAIVRREKLVTEKALQQSQIESERKDEIATQRQLFLYAIGAGLILAIAFGIVVFRAYRSKKINNALITKQKEAVEQQKSELDLQNKVVEERNKEITDSINYARRIQKAILPSEKTIDDHLPNSFVLYKPKDIVSGDFYWVEKREDEVLFAVADCTGHGVPGAMVSVVCSNGLTRAVREYGKISPGELLNQTAELIEYEFSKNKDRVADGMDIAICRLKGNTLTYAGANRPLWICRDGEIIEVEGDRKSIISGEESGAFTEHELELQPNDVVYLFSNGFVDQFGGEEGKKLKLSNLRRFVIAMHSFESFKQKVMINKAFEDWKGGMEQMDDVCMLGVKIGK